MERLRTLGRGLVAAITLIGTTGAAHTEMRRLGIVHEL